MFRRFKKDEGAPGRLIDDPEPKLSWTSGDGANSGSNGADAFDEDLQDESGTEAEDGEPGEDEADSRTDEERAADLRAELDREAEEFGLTNQDPTEMYGPNGEDVETLLDSLADIDDATAEAIADAYEAIPEAERKVAQAVVRRRYRGGGRESELWAAEHAVSDWLAAMQLDGDDLALYSVVADAATDAVDALVLEDELADVDFNTLYGPWSDVMDSDEDESEDGEDDKEDEAVEEHAPAKGSSSAGAAASPAKGPSSARTAASPAKKPAEEATKVPAEAPEPAEPEGEFGPNTELVLQFLTKLAALTAAETSELVTAWRRQPKEDLSLAHRDLQALADEDHGWREQMRLAQEEVFAWMAGRSEKRDYSFGTAQGLGRVREVAGPAVADAVAALAMADILESADAAILYAPWAEVIGEPELPVYEDDEADEADEDADEDGEGR